jgi:arginyl-tRNA--protein-N-Asp/Glu arginylyltransferase
MLEIARAITDPETCSYLRDRPSRNELRLVAAMAPDEYGQALEEGFRRFGMVLFRSSCPGCSGCVPIRVVVDRFRPSKSQRRVARRNQDVQVEAGLPCLDEERLALYNAFHAERSARVGWESRTLGAEEYRRTFLENIAPTLELSYRVEGRLVAVAYADHAPESLNSIHCFHHPDFKRRSLGTFDVLTEIELARRAGLRRLYLGYLVAGCRSMAYKGGFRPAEVRIDGRWQPFKA